MDYEEVENLTMDTEVISKQSDEFLTYEIIFTLFGVVGIISDAVIVYAIFHFRRLRTATNFFLANWAIADICSLIENPTNYRIISAAIGQTSSPKELMCFFFHSDLIFHCVAIQFMFLLTIDWGVSVHFQKAEAKFKNGHPFMITALWMLALVFCILSTAFCATHSHQYVTELLFYVSYFLLLLNVLGLHVASLVQKCRKRPANRHPPLILIVASVFAGNWFVGLFNFMVLETSGFGHHWMVEFIALCFNFVSPICVLIVLCRLDNDFYACVRQIFKKSRDRYEEAVEEPQNCVKLSDVREAAKEEIRV